MFHQLSRIEQQPPKLWVARSIRAWNTKIVMWTGISRPIFIYNLIVKYRKIPVKRLKHLKTYIANKYTKCYNGINKILLNLYREMGDNK